MRQYADSAAYEAATQSEAPGNVDLLLRTASRVVDALLIARVYPVDTAGMPTDADHVQALSDATVAIASDPEVQAALAPGGEQQWDSVAIGSVKLQGPKGRAYAGRVLGLPVPVVALVHLSGVGEPCVVVT